MSNLIEFIALCAGVAVGYIMPIAVVCLCLEFQRRLRRLKQKDNQ